MGGYAWVTLATNNSYSLGALVLAHSLKKANTAHNLAVLITPAVSESMREQLETVFDVVKVVDVLDSKDEAHLALMKRPDLGITFTKIHCWRLVEFEKCVFLDADTLVVKNCDELFEREEFSAAPDVSWPDCFNSGVFVYRPSIETFSKLLQFAVENRSFDGGDQGLLNQYFSDWATEDIKKHLPFVYNLTSVAAYSYIPAFKHYGAETRIVHFIGTGKPWLQPVDAATRTVSPTSGSEHLTPLLQQWWDLFCEKVHPNLDKNLESSNNGMSHSPVEACSNSLPVALIDETQTPRLIEPCTPYREKDDFRQCNLPYQPFDVKGSSGELLNEGFLLASVVSPKALEVSLDEQQRQDEDRMEEKSKNDWREDQIKKDVEVLESNIRINRENCTIQEPEKTYEEKKIEDETQDLEPQQKQEDPPPSKNPFEYNSFFPDDTCINNYLERNVKTYQPFDNHHHHHHHHKHPHLSQYQRLQESYNELDSNKDNQEVEPNISSLPRFLTLPEDDRRQSGNVEIHSPKRDFQSENELPQEDFPIENHEHPSKEPTLSRDDIQTEPIIEKRELTKSKSMPYLPCDVTVTQELPPAPPRSIWKSQPDITTDFNRKYSMPKLKPILPKNSFNKSIPSATSKVTQYTEFLMSSEYKDPIYLPKDKVGFVEMHIRQEAKLRRSKSEVDIRSKFGPLPYALSPEVKKPVIPKKIPFRHLENELYDLSQCKRQLGNKPKAKCDDRRKENICSLPALKPIVPARDIKSTAVKKRKSKKLSPGDRGREEIHKRDPEIREVKERKRVIKFTPRNVSVNTNRNDLDEILNRLREFSKNYQHYFGVVTDTNKKVVKSKNVTAEAKEQDGGECTSSDIFKTISIPVRMSSKESQTGEEITCAVESSEFRQFRNYVKDQREANQKGLLSLQEILSESVKRKRENLTFSSNWTANKETEESGNSLMEIINSGKEGNETSKLAEKYKQLKVQDPFVHSRQEYSNYQSLSKSNENECNNTTQNKASMQKHIESLTCTGITPNLRDSNSSDCGTKTVSLLYRAKDISLNLSILHESNESKAKGIIEKTVQSHSKPYNIIPAFTYEIKETIKSNETVSNHFEKQKEHQANVREEVNILLNTKPSSKEQRGTEKALILHSKECQVSDEIEFSVAPPDVVAPENFTKSNGIIDAESHQEDVSNTGIRKQEREGQSRKNNPSRNAKVKISTVHSKNEEMTRESLDPILQQKDGKGADIDDFGEAKLSIRNLKKCDSDSRKNSDLKFVSEEMAPIVHNSTTLQKEQNGHVMRSRKEKTNEESTKEKDDENSDREEDDQKTFSFSTTREKVVEKQSESILCASDSEAPRSSRKTLSTAEVITSDLVEEMMTKTVCECDSQSRSPTPQSSSHSIPQKARKPRSSPKKVSGNCFKKKNRFETPSKNDSPGGTDQFIAKETFDKNSKRKTLPPSACTPRSGNAQSENLEDLKSASGIAGAIAQLNLESGSDQSPESITASAAHQEYLRRQNWETGNMDYMGRDSFDNIWSKICQTIEAKESEESVAGSPRPPAETSDITEEAEKFKEVALAESTVSLSSVFQKCPEHIETLPGEPVVGPVEDDQIIFSKPENKRSCLMNVAEEEEAEIEGSASKASLLVAENVKLSDILHPRLPSGEAESSQIESLDTCEKSQDIMTNEKELGKEQSQRKEEKAEKVLPCEERKNLQETLSNVTKNKEPSVNSSEEKPQLTVLPTEIKSEPLAPEKLECKTVAICQPPMSLPQTQDSVEQKQPETLIKEKNLEEKAEECKTVAIPVPPVVFPGAPVTEGEKRQSKREKMEKKSDVKSEPIPLPPPDSPQELDFKTIRSDSLKEESKQKKGVFTKILEMVGVAPKEKNGSEISKSVFYDTEGSAFSKQIEIDNQTSIMKESEEPSDEQALAQKVETAQSAGNAQIIEEADKLKSQETEQEKGMPPEESHKAKEPSSSNSEKKKNEIITDLKGFRETQEIKLKELKHSDKSQEEKPSTKEPEKPSGNEARSKNQSKKQKSGQSKPERKELKASADSAQASVAKRKSPSPKLTMPQNPPETEVTTPTPPPHPDVSPRRNSALLKVDDSILETPPVPEFSKESIDEAVKGKASTEIDIMEKARSEVESLLQDCRSGTTEAEEDSNLINTMKLMTEEQFTKRAKDDIEELRVTSEEERKQHKGEIVSSKLSDQILKAIPPPRRKAISEASASTSAIPKASGAPEQKNPPGESKTKTSKSSSIPVPPPRSRGKPAQPAPSKGKGKK